MEITLLQGIKLTRHVKRFKLVIKLVFFYYLIMFRVRSGLGNFFNRVRTAKYAKLINGESCSL